MQTHSPREITQLLVAWGDGDQAALDELTPLATVLIHTAASARWKKAANIPLNRFNGFHSRFEDCNARANR